jgi:hypothetical protein
MLILKTNFWNNILNSFYNLNILGIFRMKKLRFKISTPNLHIFSSSSIIKLMVFQITTKVILAKDSQKSLRVGLCC